MEPVKIIIIGAGSRGNIYASYSAIYPEKLKVVGVAEPRDFYRNDMAKKYNVPKENVVKDWTEFTGRERFADVVAITTQDREHVDPTIKFAELGYNILLEKPISPFESECDRLYENLKDKNILLSVCHVLRYTPYTTKLKELLDSGVIGEVISMQHLEPVGYWHQAHSFVRGNWHNESESSFMLLAKSCHDIDWINYIMGSECKSVASFGSLKHFKKSEKPEGAGFKCTNCSYEPKCPYSAIKLYIKMANDGNFGWPNDILSPDLTVAGITKAVKEGPYGKCVYECDNDVVDNQVVAMEYDGGKTVSFTMTAFTEMAYRRTSIFGTRGELYGDGDKISIYDFMTDKRSTITIDKNEDSPLSGHGNGDEALMDAFIKAVSEKDPKYILSGLNETISSHKLVFAAEKARKEGKVIIL
jgi:predicted dehydrogenase